MGAATAFFERKFIRSCGLVGHIEDVVVDSSCRGMRLGQRCAASPPPPPLHPVTHTHPSAEASC